MNIIKIFRDAITGRFTSKKHVEEHPESTVTERVTSMTTRGRAKQVPSKVSVATIENITTGETWTKAQLNAQATVRVRVGDQLRLHLSDATGGKKRYWIFNLFNLQGVINYAHRFEFTGPTLDWSIPAAGDTVLVQFNNDFYGDSGVPSGPCDVYLDEDTRNTNGWLDGGQIRVFQS